MAREIFSGKIDLSVKARVDASATYMVRCPECGHTDHEFMYYLKFHGRISDIEHIGAYFICYHCSQHVDEDADNTEGGLTKRQIDFTLGEASEISNRPDLSLEEKVALIRMMASNSPSGEVEVTIPLEEWLKLFPEGETEEEMVRSVLVRYKQGG